MVLGAVCACSAFWRSTKRAGGSGIFIGMVLLGRRGKEPTIYIPRRGAVCAGLYGLCSVSGVCAAGMGLTVFLQRVSLILNDPQSFTTSQRLALLASQALNTAKLRQSRWPPAWCSVCCGGPNPPKTGLDRPCPEPWAILAALLCVVRAVADSSSDERYFMPALVLAAASGVPQGARRSAGSRCSGWACCRA